MVKMPETSAIVLVMADVPAPAAVAVAMPLMFRVSVEGFTVEIAAAPKHQHEGNDGQQ